MKKVNYRQFGNPDVLNIVQADKPTIDAGSFLIKVQAISINPLDWKIRNGTMKLMTGTAFPKGIGIDFSGIIEKAGCQTTAFAVGDQVFGAVNVMRGGALAEYVVAKETQIQKIPENLSFEQAAALPVVGTAAAKALSKLAKVKPGMHILIHGATGGIGMMATQIAKRQGAIVTAVVGTHGIGHAKRWKADHIIDYQKEPVLDQSMTYDIILNASDKLSFSDAQKIMKPTSVFISCSPTLLQLITSAFRNLFSRQKNKCLISQPDTLSLSVLSDYVEKGMEVVVNKVYPLSEYILAYKETEQGGIIGKNVISLA